MTAADIAAEVPADCPVLVLDACSCLDPARVGRAETHGEFRALERLLAACDADPPGVRIVLPLLIRAEVADNRNQVQGDGVRAVREHLERHQSLDDLARLVGRPASSPPAGLARATPLVDDLLWYVDQLLEIALTLDEVPACITRAVDRVKQKRRPARRGQVKDAMHWEHFLHLGEALRPKLGMTPIGFVSSNEKDFWAALPADRGSADAALAKDMLPHQLTFFGRLTKAADDLGL